MASIFKNYDTLFIVVWLVHTNLKIFILFLPRGVNEVYINYNV
jgi:hypothetical protein